MEYGHRVVVEQLRSHYRAYGVELAERGCVVLAPAYPLMANYQPDLNALGCQSGTMKAIWDNVRALDLLESLPFVKKGKFGALGHSLGGHNAIYTAVLTSASKWSSPVAASIRIWITRTETSKAGPANAICQSC